MAKIVKFCGKTQVIIARFNLRYKMFTSNLETILSTTKHQGGDSLCPADGTMERYGGGG